MKKYLVVLICLIVFCNQNPINNGDEQDVFVKNYDMTTFEGIYRYKKADLWRDGYIEGIAIGNIEKDDKIVSLKGEYGWHVYRWHGLIPRTGNGTVDTLISILEIENDNIKIENGEIKIKIIEDNSLYREGINSLWICGKLIY